MSRSCFYLRSHLVTIESPFRFGHAFMMDTGSSTGDIIGHSKVSCCSNMIIVSNTYRIALIRQLMPLAFANNAHTVP